MPLMMKLYMTSIALIATPSMGLVFLIHHLTDDVMATGPFMRDVLTKGGIGPKATLVRLLARI